MTKLLEQAIERTKELSANRQNEVGEIILSLVAQDKSSLHLSTEQVDEVRRRMANTGSLVSEDEMRIFFNNLLG